jgi:GntR family transcriptional regulator
MNKALWEKAMAHALELNPGVPVVRLLHIDYDPGGRTLPVADNLHAADRHEFAFEWTEPDGVPVDE